MSALVSALYASRVVIREITAREFYNRLDRTSVISTPKDIVYGFVEDLKTVNAANLEEEQREFQLRLYEAVYVAWESMLEKREYFACVGFVHTIGGFLNFNQLLVTDVDYPTRVVRSLMDMDVVHPDIMAKLWDQLDQADQADQEDSDGVYYQSGDDERRERISEGEDEWVQSEQDGEDEWVQGDYDQASGSDGTVEFE
jgi:hypothetical protein